MIEGLNFAPTQELNGTSLDAQNTALALAEIGGLSLNMSAATILKVGDVALGSSPGNADVNGQGHLAGLRPLVHA